MLRFSGLLALAGCSLSTVQPDACTENTQCVEAFGYGNRCDLDEGWCASRSLNPRCTIYPEELSLPVDADEVILLGQIGTTGTDTYTARAQATRLAVLEVNDAEGLDGRSFGIVECSTSASSEYTQSEATALIAEHLVDDVGVLALIGPYSSSDTETAFTTIEPFGKLLISPSATSPALTDLDGSSPSDEAPGLLWRVAPSDALQGKKIATYLDDAGYSHVGVIYQAGAYGNGLQEVFSEEIYALNPSVDLELVEFSDSGEIADAVADVGAAGVEITLFISSESEDSSTFLLEASDDGRYTCDVDGELPYTIALPDAAASVDVLEAASQASDLFPCVRGTRPKEAAGPLFDSFVAAYDNRFDDDPSGYSYTAQSYDAGWMAIYGATWAWYQEAGMSGTELARGLRKLSSGDEVSLRATSWSTVKASFEAGESIDITGTSGKLDFDPETEETTAPIEVWKISDDGDAIEVL